MRALPPVPPRKVTPPLGVRKPTPNPGSGCFPKVPPPPTMYPDETPTIRVGEIQVVYQTILALLDSMTQNDRLEFIELANIFRDLSKEDRAYLIEEANALSCRSSREST